MNEKNTKPVQVVLTYNVNNLAKTNVQTKLIAGPQQHSEVRFIKLDENHKINRRYSFDDNGGGYRGL